MEEEEEEKNRKEEEEKEKKEEEEEEQEVGGRGGVGRSVQPGRPARRRQEAEARGRLVWAWPRGAVQRRGDVSR